MSDTEVSDTARRLLREREGVSLGVLEPRDEIAGGRLPDAVLVLADPREALGVDTAPSQLRERRHEIDDLPPEDSERLRPEVVDLRHPERRLTDAEDARERRVVEKLESQDTLVERMRAIQVGCGHEADVGVAGKHLHANLLDDRRGTFPSHRPVAGDVVYVSRVAEVLLFHHAQGLTPGVVAFADDLRAAGHTVHTPDLYDGNTFDDLDEGVGYAKQVGFETILERGRRAADDLPGGLVYAGFSLGVMPAQLLAQTRAGATGALFFSAALPPSEFGDGWPQGVPLQIHLMEGDEWAQEDLPAARELAETVGGAELFLYPGDKHLFADRSLADYDEGAAATLQQRVLAFLETTAVTSTR